MFEKQVEVDVLCRDVCFFTVCGYEIMHTLLLQESVFLVLRFFSSLIFTNNSMFVDEVVKVELS